MKAASDAKISLLRVPSNFMAPSYEIVVGAESNSKTILHTKAAGGDLIAFQVNTPDILSSTELRQFWVKWSNGTIRFGKGGVVGLNELMNYVDPQPAFRRHVHSIAVASGLGAAEWELGQEFGSRKYYTDKLKLINVIQERIYERGNVRFACYVVSLLHIACVTPCLWIMSHSISRS